MTKTILAVLTALAMLTACETFEGLGRDTAKLGNNIANSAERHK